MSPTLRDGVTTGDLVPRLLLLFWGLVIVLWGLVRVCVELVVSLLDPLFSILWGVLRAFSQPVVRLFLVLFWGIRKRFVDVHSTLLFGFICN